MKYNLLKMVQLILSSMDSDEVNSISDTTESLQIVDIIETTYNNIVSNLNLPSQWDLFELTGSGDNDRPTIMYLPDGVVNIEWIQYDNRESGSTVRNMVAISPLPKYEFFQRINTLDSADANVYQYNYLVGAETFDVRGYDDRFPTYFTTVDNRTLVFDNYKSSLDTTLVGNKTMCYGQKIPTFTRSDSFTPDLDAQHFAYLYNEAEAACHTKLKQQPNVKAEQWARRSQVSIQRNKHNVPQESYPNSSWIKTNFGRK